MIRLTPLGFTLDLDAAIAPAIYDQAYLQSNIAGGEGFDWFYASATDRDSQTRTLITTGTTTAQLHKSSDGRTAPSPGQTCPATFVTGMPSAVQPFRTATRTWNSAT